LAAVLDISSAVILFYGTDDQKLAYADFKQLRKTGINPFS